MSNPMLSDAKLERASTGWAKQHGANGGWDAPSTEQHVGPLDDRDHMTVGGTATATLVLLFLLIISASVGWSMTGSPEEVVGLGGEVTYNYSIPVAAWVGVGIGLLCVFGLWFRPQFAKYVAPVYALAQGVFVGAISRMYETFYDGIVVQAVGVTMAVFVTMLVLYKTQIIKVTERFRRIIVGATVGIMIFYGVSFLISLFAGSGSVSFISSPSIFGIGFSLFVAGIAAMNLALDFDFIERGAQQRLSKDFEWYGAFAILVTVIWLYLEILRLLAKLRD